MKTISFIQPSRNNLKYLKWSYNSIRKNLGYVHEICMADDFSNDGTWEWLQDIAKKDPNVKIHRNEGPTRLGHTILYDTLINDYATNDVVMIYHADMYALPGLDKEIDKHIKPGVVVSATRIEPPLHPDGPEKILADYGIEPEEFNEHELLRDLDKFKDTGKTTEGIFAPWAIMKEDFQSIGGHDPLYAPQSKEDSDIFNRFLLNGYKFIQTWEGFVYHMTCRGSRFADGAKRNPDGQVFMKNRETDEWLAQNIRSTRNFIRKWGHFVKHDALLKPIVPPKYNIGFEINNCTEQLLELLEPWCSGIYVDCDIKNYIKKEQPNTMFDLSERVKEQWCLTNSGLKYDEYVDRHDILIKFDGNKFNDNSFQYIQQLSEIIANDEDLHEGESDEEFELGIFRVSIKKLKTYEKELIICKS
jgi:glycosyltransferase involved in cell wall biosynthesis